LGGHVTDITVSGKDQIGDVLGTPNKTKKGKNAPDASELLQRTCNKKFLIKWETQCEGKEQGKKCTEKGGVTPTPSTSYAGAHSQKEKKVTK